VSENRSRVIGQHGARRDDAPVSEATALLDRASHHRGDDPATVHGEQGSGHGGSRSHAASRVARRRRTLSESQTGSIR